MGPGTTPILYSFIELANQKQQRLLWKGEPEIYSNFSCNGNEVLLYLQFHFFTI